MTSSAITSATYQRSIDAHTLVGSRSGEGRTIYVPPRSIDPLHVQDPMTLVELSGRGRLAAFSVVHIPSSAMIAAGYGRENPHCVGIVILDEGPSISAQIVGVDAKHPETIVIGARVTAEFIGRAAEGNGPERTVLAFRPDA